MKGNLTCLAQCSCVSAAAYTRKCVDEIETGGVSILRRAGIRSTIIDLNFAQCPRISRYTSTHVGIDDTRTSAINARIRFRTVVNH